MIGEAVAPRQPRYREITGLTLLSDMTLATAEPHMVGSSLGVQLESAAAVDCGHSFQSLPSSGGWT